MTDPERLKERIRSIIQLPALPSVVMEVIGLVEDPRTSASTLAKVISSDQALTAKLLKIANSPFYGFPKKIATVDFAVIVLGFDALKEIIISISLVNSLARRSDSTFNAQKFWDHSIATGVVARRLARDFGYRISGEVFVSGLLHDMGISILHRYFNSEYNRILEITEDSNLTIREAEESVLGVTHGEVGGWLAERWNLPNHLTEAIAFHHTPMKSQTNVELVSIIHVADIIANKITDHVINFDIGYDFDPEALKKLKLDDQNLMQELFANYKEKIAEDIQQATVISPMRAK
jgi:HD-like signal output (HDOD) protein